MLAHAIDTNKSKTTNNIGIKSFVEILVTGI